MKNLASPLHRFVAYLIDVGICIAFVLFLVQKITLSMSLSTMLNQALVALIVFIFGQIVIGVLTSWLTAQFGGSIGKLLTGIKVVEENGQHITLKKSFFRYYVGYMVSSTLLWLGFLWVFKDKKRQTWHDQILGTYVVTTNATGLYIGIITLLAILTLNIYLTTSSISSVKQNLPLYSQIVSDIKTELEPKPTAMPDPTPSASDTLIREDSQQVLLKLKQQVGLTELVNEFEFPWNNTDGTQQTFPGHVIYVKNTDLSSEINSFFKQNNFKVIQEESPSTRSFWVKNDLICVVDDLLVRTPSNQPAAIVVSCFTEPKL